MSIAAFFFVITLASTVIASISDSFLRCITCPCGFGNQNYTHCINKSILNDFTCERWSHCQTCKANITSCITCHPGHFGPTCSENRQTQRKRQNDPSLLNHPRYRRQSVSGRHTDTRCLNHGSIAHGRMIVIPPFDDSSQHSEDFDDFDFPYGTRLKFKCDNGFTLVGKDTLRCGSNGYWTESIPECVGETPTSQETCKHPGVEVNGRIVNPPVDPQRRRQVFLAGTELRFACNDGFESEGATVLACLSNGKWTSLPPKCRRTPTAEVLSLPLGGEGLHRLRIAAVRRRSQMLLQDRESENEIFAELPCRHPGMVINGMFNGDLLKSSFPVGTAVTFRCIEGTQRKGPMTIFCQLNGRWSEPPPSCEPKRNGKRR